ncbi:MAG: tRNA (adenosine(37)-N6)-dimethylallyltransferase MiaA, partial [Acidobacteria bacterium]|nr:tRNA (adenosine(37)-N6)-dimethylallyltransferase MiaA [Acidobacteriota bacterium]
RAARPLLAGITARGKLPVVAGGTGFYLRALLDGLIAAPEADPGVRGRLQERESRRAGSLHRVLRRLDRAAAGRIHANDTKKIIRALEIRLITGNPITGLHKQGRDRLKGYQVIKIGLNPPRDLLYEKLNTRSDAMFAGGLLDEVRRILAMGYGPASKPFESHGYKQALGHIQGTLSLEETLDQAKQNTRRYAKRQVTWYSREGGVQWFRTFGDEATTRAEVLRLIEGYLQSTECFRKK